MKTSAALLLFALISVVLCDHSLRTQEYTITYFTSNTCEPGSSIVQRGFILGQCYNLKYNDLNTECAQSLECLFARDQDPEADLLCPREFSITARTVLPDVGVVLDVNPTGCSTNSPSDEVEFLFDECRASQYEGCFTKIRLGAPDESESPASILAIPAMFLATLLALIL